MAETAAVNASPIIYLARAHQFGLLQLAAAEVLVPSAVADEILVRGQGDPAARALSTTPWIRKVEAPDVPRSVLAWDLGPGESAVIAWALAHPGCLAVIDDLEGRRCAETHDIPLRGTLGLVLRAKRQGVIPRARPILETMRASGMYLSTQLLDLTLAEVGE